MRFLPALFITGLLSITQFVNAEEYDEKLFSLSLEDLLNVKVTSSTRTEESLKTVPSAITVFTREQIERIGVDYLHELLDFVPGYQTQRAGDNSSMYSYSARGRRNGAQSKEILLIMDGKALNSPRNDGANGSFSLIPLSNIEKIEVIRGPGSALYGSSAYSGVINIQSRQSHKTFRLKIGSLESFSIEAAWHVPIGDWQLSMFGILEKDKGDEYDVDDSFNADPQVRILTPDPRTNIFLDVKLEGDRSRFSYLFGKQDTDQFYVIESVENSFNQYQIETNVFGFEHEFTLGSDISSKLSVGHIYSSAELSLQLLAAGSLTTASIPSSQDAFLSHVFLDGYNSKVKWHNTKELDEHQNIQFGIEWRKQQETKAKAFSNYDLGELAMASFPITYFGNFSEFTLIGTEQGRSTYSLYGQYLKNFDNQTNITLGIRIDDFDDVGRRASPRIALVKNLSERNALKLLYGEAFRAPSLNETQLINNPVIIGNANLEHEIVKTWDLILVSDFSFFSFTLDLFHNQYENPINSEIVPGNTRQFLNLPSSEASGIELELNYEVNNKWLVNSTFSRFYKTPDAAFRESESLFSLLINYQNHDWNWNLGAVFHGEREFLSGVERLYIDDYWLVNSKLIYQLSKNHSIDLKVKNLLDEYYESPASGNRLTQGLPNRGREFSLRSTWNF